MTLGAAGRRWLVLACVAVGGCAVADTTVYRVPVGNPTDPHIVGAEWLGRRNPDSRRGAFGHLLGLGAGRFTFAVDRTEAKPLTAVVVRVKCSAASKTFPGPADATAKVALTINGVDAGARPAGRYDLRGTLCEWRITDPAALKTISAAEQLRLTFSVAGEGRGGPGLALYGGELLHPDLAFSPVRAEERIPLEVTLYHENVPDPAAAPDRPVAPQAPSGPEKVVQLTNPIDKTAQRVLIVLPTDHENRRPHGLLIHHHPYGGKHDHVHNLRAFLALANHHNLIVASGDLHGNGWGSELVMADLEQIYQHCMKAYPIDPNRVYAHGNSLGGAMATYVGMHPERFAAMVIVHGLLDPRGEHEQLKERDILWKDMEAKLGKPGPAYDKAGALPRALAGAFLDVPTLLWHGEVDDVVPPSQSLCLARAINARGGRAKAIVIPNHTHDYWIFPLVEAFDFYARNVRGRKQPHPFGKVRQVRLPAPSNEVLVLTGSPDAPAPHGWVPTKTFGQASDVTIDRGADAWTTVTAGKDGGCVSLYFDEPLDASRHECLALQVTLPPRDGEQVWVPLGLRIDDERTVDWVTSFHHDSRLGAFTGRTSELVVPVRALIAAHLDPRRITAVHLTLPAGQATKIGNARLSPETRPAEKAGEAPATPRPRPAGPALVLDTLQGGALVQPLPPHVPPQRPGCPVAASTRPVGPYFEYATDLHDWHRSNAGTNHARRELFETAEGGAVHARYRGHVFGPWPTSHVDTGTTCTFDYTFAPPAKDSTQRIEITVELKRTGSDVKGLAEAALVWPLGPLCEGFDPTPFQGMDDPELPPVESLQIPRRGGGMIEIRIEEVPELAGRSHRLVPDEHGRWQLRIQLGILKDGVLPRGASWTGRFVLTLSLANEGEMREAGGGIETVIERALRLRPSE